MVRTGKIAIRLYKQRPEGIRREFAEGDVVSFEIRQEEQTEGAFTFFFADAIRREKQAEDEAIREREGRESAEDQFGALGGSAPAARRCEPEPCDNCDGNCRGGHAAPIKSRGTRSDAQLTFYNRKKAHSAHSANAKTMRAHAGK
jgi:hypothetical protein